MLQLLFRGPDPSILADQERAFQFRIRELFIQECLMREEFLRDIESASLSELSDISREVTEAAERHDASGGRILDYIPRDRPLTRNIYAFSVGTLLL
eukprot:1633900-Heterocapsa_arctica.AAC.1